MAGLYMKGSVSLPIVQWRKVCAKRCKWFYITLSEFVWVHAVGRKNQYDGVTEYLVVLREKGSRQEEKSQEEIHRKIGKAWSYSYIYTSYLSYLGKAMLHIYTWANIVSKTEQCTLIFLWNTFIWQWFKPFSPDGWSSGAGPRSFLKDRGHGC